MKKLLSMLLLAAFLLLSACGTVGTEENSNSLTETTLPSTTDGETGEASVSPDNALVLVQNEKSEYVVVCNYKDNIGRAFATQFCDFMFRNFGVSLDMRSESSTYKKEIVIGNTGRDATLAVKAQMNDEDDFAVCAVGDHLVMYATDELQYDRLLIALRDYIFANASSNEVKFSIANNFVASLNPDMIFGGSEVLLMENYTSTYSIVYGENDEDSMIYAVYLKQYLQELLGINFPILADSKQVEHEIVLKGADRSALKKVEKKLKSENDFSVSVLGDDIVVTGTDNEETVLAMMYLADWCKNQFNGTRIMLNENNNYVHSQRNYSFEYSAKELCERYQSIYNTYSSYHEDKLAKNSWRNDQYLINDLIERMGASFAVYNGSSSVLYNGYVRKLDTNDYSCAAVISGGTVKVPAEFANNYFGTTLASDDNGYVNLTSYLSGRSDYSLYVSADGKLAVVIPSGVASFANGSATDGKYTNQQYCNRMLRFFEGTVGTERMPEPNVNTEQSRTVVEYIEYPQYVPDFTTNVYQTTFSPSILAISDTTYYVSYEICDTCNFEEISTYTVVKKTEDGGNTWITVTERIPDLKWASIFENKGVIYLLGTSSETKGQNAIIVKLTDNGKYESQVLFTYVQVMGTAPGRVVHANGRIYKAYHIASISASEDADLMQPSSWTRSNLTNTETLAPDGAEGSMIVGKTGQLYQIMHTGSKGEAYVLKLSADGKTYSDAQKIDFPASLTKTAVVYDTVSGKYIALCNVNTTSSQPRQRNILALGISDDLYHWEIKEYLLVDREMINFNYSTVSHGYQYADFEIVGDDIVMIVREAFGYTNSWHDGNYETFYRITNFRDLLS